MSLTGFACHYCALRGERVSAVEVAHDRRGCVFVCEQHARWRETTSRLGGHSKCPEGLPDGPGPLPPPRR